MPALYAHALSVVLMESIWPTRCAICDKPGELVCPRCLRSLPYIDHWSACGRCGAPFGNVVCSECNPISLKALGEDALPFSTCTCVTVFNDQSKALITTYKDSGERRLASCIGALLADAVYPAWAKNKGACALPPTVSFIPATLKAFRRRGFDHAELLAENTATRLGLSCVPLFKRPKGKDQRSLSRLGRLGNMEKSFQLIEGVAVPKDVLLIDDVYTTGSTLIAASKALAHAGVENIHCATFARVW